MKGGKEKIEISSGSGALIQVGQKFRLPRNVRFYFPDKEVNIPFTVELNLEELDDWIGTKALGVIDRNIPDIVFHSKHFNSDGTPVEIIKVKEEKKSFWKKLFS